MKKSFISIAFSMIFGTSISQNSLCLSQAPFNPINSSTPFSFCSPDLNNDGFKDIVIGGIGGIQIFLSTGNSSFQATPFTLTNSGFNYFVLDRDFNSDGNIDLASCSFNDNYVNVWLGTGTGTFAPVTQFLVTSNPNSIACSDFNNDGFFDIASADYNSGFITVLINNGAGSFSSGGSFTVAANPQYLITDNFNNDSYTDIAVCNGSVLTVLQGNSNGIFTTAANKTVAFSSVLANNFSFAVKDLNNDGNSDIIGLIQNTQSLGILYGNGNFSFQPLITTTLSSYPETVAVSDFDLNGYNDVILTNASYNLSFFFNGPGGFASPINYSLTTNNMFQPPYYLLCPDMNNDGKPDVFVGFDNGEPSQVLLNCNTVTNIQSSFKQSEEVSIYPNPASNILNLSSNVSSELLFISISDMQGRLILSKPVVTQDYKCKLDLNMTKGIYLVTIKNQRNNVTTKKLVITN